MERGEVSNANWYARKLQQQSEGAPAPASTPMTPAMPPSLPPSLPPTQAPQHAPVQHQQQAPIDPNGDETVFQAAARWKGGEGMKETATCPRCGSAHIFSRSKQSITGPGGVATPAPHCFTCGWNGMWEQFSDQFNES